MLTSGIVINEVMFNQLGGELTDDWNYRKKITIHHEKVADGLTDFPVLISITDSDLASDARTDGFDIMFSPDGESKYDHEIETFNSSTGELIAWVRIPSLSSNSDTVFYMYYGKSGSADQQNPTGVWDSNYTSVWHLNETGDGTNWEYKDSTSNNNDGQGGDGTLSDVPTRVLGKIAGGQDFDGSNDFIELLPMDPQSYGDFTISAWFKSTLTTSTEDGYIFNHEEGYSTNPGITFGYTDDAGYVDRMCINIYDNGADQTRYRGTTDVVDQQYHCLVGVRSNGRIIFYVDGFEDYNDVDNDAGEIIDIDCLVGDGPFLGDDPGDTEQVNGILDEIRVSDVGRSYAWIRTEYNNQNDPGSFYTIGSEIVNLVNMQYRKAITINSSLVTADLTNFPVLINITDTDLANDARSDGNDILFTSSDGETRLDFEIESYTSGTGELFAWVRIPSLSSSTDTTIYMYYGKSDQTTSLANPEGVWDSNFVGVWHFSESGTGTRYDSTLCDNDGTTSGYDNDEATTGMIDGADDLDGTNDAINFQNPSELQITGAITIEAWFNAGYVDNDYLVAKMGEAGSRGWDLSFDDDAPIAPDGWIMFRYSTDGSTVRSEGYERVNASEWYYAVGVFNPSTYERFYLNGDLKSEDISSVPASQNDPSQNVYIGRYGGATTTYWDGIIDEVRISKSVRTWDWINATYNNIYTPTSFLNVGTEESVSTTSSSEWVELYNSGSTSENLSGWYLMDHDGNKFNLSGAGIIPPGGYVTCHLAQAGTNSSTDVYGPIIGKTIIQPDATAGKDTYLSSLLPNTNYGISTTMGLRDEDSNGYFYNGLLQFDLSNLPQADAIYDAKVWLYKYTTNGGGDSDVSVHRVTQSWTETGTGATWNTYNGVTFWASAGGDYNSVAEDFASIDGSLDTWYSWDITSLVRSWKSGTYQNYGMIFINDDGVNDDGFQYFYSSDYSSTTLRPKLVVSCLNSSITNILDYTDGLSLVHDTNDAIMDYLAWGGDPGTCDDDAVAQNMWTDGEFIDIASISENMSIGRDKDSSDTNSTADWEGIETGLADPYGVHAGAQTLGARNLDQLIVINEIMYDTAGNAFNNAWPYRKKITILSSQVAGDLREFPMLINITDSDLKTKARSDENDIMFVSSDGDTKLDHEIEKYDSSTGQLIAWVKIPYLSAINDTEIFMYYGNSGSSNQQNHMGVWSNGYVGVYHMQEATGNINNSAGEFNDGVRYNTPIRNAGKFGYGQNFSGIYEEDMFRLGDLGICDGVNKNITFSVWAYINDSALDDYGKIFSKRNNAGTDSLYNLRFNDDVTDKDIGIELNEDFSAYIGVAKSTWVYIVGTYDGSSLILYLNGTNAYQKSQSGPLMSSSAPTSIGGRDNTPGDPFGGFLDEARFSKVARSAEWVATEWNNQFSPGTFYCVNGEDINTSAWNYRKQISLNSSKVSSSLDQFPVLISITDTDLKNKAQSNGDDIVFTDWDGKSKLHHEIESYNNTTGELIVWVKVANLSSVLDTFIYMYYNNSGASDQSNPTEVWDSKYVGVWHLKEDPGPGGAGDIKDSTIYYSNGTAATTMTSADQVEGKIDGSIDFDGSDDYINLPNDLSILKAVSEVTLQAWVNLGAIPLDQCDIIGIGINSGIPTENSRACLELGSFDEIECGGRAPDSQASVQRESTTTSPISTGNWYHVVGIIDYPNDDVIIYVNAQSQSTSGIPDFTNTVTDNSVSSYSKIGCDDDASKDFWDGILDEVRVSNVARSTAWIDAEFKNQNDPASFYSVGTEKISTPAFSYRKPITIDSNKVTADLTNFPILVNITDSDLSSKVRSDGYDIVFTSSDGKTHLEHELESYTSGSGKLIAWVNVTSLSSSTDTVIYMYYSKSDQSVPLEYPAGVWDENYVAVWHLVEVPSGASDMKDSAGNHDGTSQSMEAADQVNGQIGGSLHFDGNNEYVLMADSSDWTLSPDLDWTLQGWFNFDTLPGVPDWDAMISTPSDNYCFEFNEDSGDTTLNWWDNIADHESNGQSSLSTDKWHYGVLVLDFGVSSGSSWYLDGSSLGSFTAQNRNVNPTGLTIGGATFTTYFTGKLDEIRFSNSLRSAAWIDTEFNNQNDTSSFYELGVEESITSCSSTAIAYEWVELYNPSNSACNLNGLYLSDYDGNLFDLSGGVSLLAGGYLVCHLGEAGTNSSTDIYGPIINSDTTSLSMLAPMDDLAVKTSTGFILDYLAWGSDPLSDDDLAVIQGIWTDGDFVDTSNITENETIGRDKDSTDTNSTSDWENTTTNQADPFGVNATMMTPGAQNIDYFDDVVINEILFNSTDSGWLYRKKIEINSAKVVGDLTNFPMLFTITDPDLANKARSDGYDIYFTSSDGKTRLNHEIEHFNDTTGELIAWVNITSLSSSADTTIYMYYGNSGQGTTMENPTGVWNDNYVGVWHLNETSTATGGIKDSTSFDNDGTKYGDTTLGVSGKIGKAADFDGNQDSVDILSSDSLNNFTAFTFEAWIDIDTYDPFGNIVGKPWDQWETDPYDLYLLTLGEFGNDNTGVGVAIGGSCSYRYSATASISTTGFYNIVGVWNGSVLQNYVNGQASGGTTSASGSINYNDEPISIGRYSQGWPGTYDIDGIIDEVRISNINRTDDWIATEFNNQNDTNSFYSVYKEELIGYQWVELYNNGTFAADLTAWTLTDNDGNTFTLTGAGTLPVGGYLICHLGQTGTNSSTNVYGYPGNFLEDSDDLALKNSYGTIVDYVAWGGDAGTDDDLAVTRGEWTDGTYVDTSQIVENETIGRNKDSTDTNSPTDWENGTNKADPYGVNATMATQGAQNIDCIIPEFNFILIPILTISLFILLINHYYSGSYLNQNSNKKHRQKKLKKKGNNNA